MKIKFLASISLIVVIGITFLLISSNYQIRDIITNENISFDEYPILENEFGIKLPESGVITSATLLHGKDTVVSMNVQIDTEEIDKLINSINYELKEIEDLSSKYSYNFKVMDNNSLVYVRYNKSVDYVELVLSKYQPFSNDVIDAILGN